MTTSPPLSPARVEQLLDQGFCIIPNAASAGLIADLEADLDPVFDATPFGQGRFYGCRTKRFGGCSGARVIAKRW